MKAKTIIETDGTDTTTGYLILSVLFGILFTLFFKDAMYLIFPILIVLGFVLSAAIDRGNVDDDLGAIGWSSQNMDVAVPLGISGGLLAIFLGGFIIKFTPVTTASIIPDFSATAFITASVVPPLLAVGANIFGQWAVVAPGEEMLARVLAAKAGHSIFKNWIIAFIFAGIFWTFLHIPTLIAQGAGVGMYMVLLLLSAITTGVYLFTKNLMAAIITHGTFNTGVITIGAGIDAGAFYVIAIVAAILAYAYISGLHESSPKRAKMARKMAQDESSTPAVTVILLILITILITVTSIMMTSVPQHILITNSTKVHDAVFGENGLASIRGNQVQYAAGDSLRVSDSGREYLKITGKQIQLEDQRYPEAVRTISASIQQNILFQKQIGTFSTTRVASIVVGQTAFNLVPLTEDVISINAIDLSKSGSVISNYNLQLAQGQAFINEGGAMLKLTKTGKQITVYLVGTGKYSQIFMKVV